MDKYVEATGFQETKQVATLVVPRCVNEKYNCFVISTGRDDSTTPGHLSSIALILGTNEMNGYWNVVMFVLMFDLPKIHFLLGTITLSNYYIVLPYTTDIK